MKRITSAIIILLISSILFASSAFTYSLSQTGEKCGDESFGTLSLSLGFAPVKEKQYGLMEIDLLLGWNRFFQGFDIVVSTPLYTSSDKVFSYAFSNRVLWEPTAGALLSYRSVREKWALGVMLSPFKFVDTQFSYEFLSPYMSFGFDGKRAYGIRIMKVTALLEV